MKIQHIITRLDNRTTVEFSPDSLVISQDNRDDGEDWTGRVHLHRDLFNQLAAQWEQFNSILAAYQDKEQ